MRQLIIAFSVLSLFCVNERAHAVVDKGQDYFHYYEAVKLLERVEKVMVRLSLPVHQVLLIKDWQAHRGKGALPGKANQLAAGPHGAALTKMDDLIEAIIQAKEKLAHLEAKLKTQTEEHARKTKALESQLQQKREALQHQQEIEQQKALAQNKQAEEKRQVARQHLEAQLQQAQQAYEKAMADLQDITVNTNEKRELIGRVGKRAEAYRAKIEDAAQQAADARAAEQKRLAEEAERKRLEEEEAESVRRETEVQQPKGFFGSVWSLAKSATATVTRVVTTSATAAKSAAVAVGHRTGVVRKASVHTEESEKEAIVKAYLNSEGHEFERQGLPMIEEHLQALKGKLEVLLADQKRLTTAVQKAQQHMAAILKKLEALSTSPAVRQALTDYDQLLKEVDRQLVEISKSESTLVNELSESMTTARIKVEALNRALEQELKTFHREASDEGGRLTEAHAALVKYISKACQAIEKDDTRTADKACLDMIREKVEKRINKLPGCAAFRTMKEWHFPAVAACDLEYLKDKHCHVWNSTKQCRDHVIGLVRGAQPLGGIVVECEALHSQSLDAALEKCLRLTSEATQIMQQYKLSPLLT